MTWFVRLFVFFPLLPSVYASAQISIRYFSSQPPADGSIPQVCLVEGESLRNQLSLFPHPQTWTFVIACDTNAWDDLMALSDHADRGRSIFGATNPNNHSTLMRGSTLLGKDAPDMTAEHMVAHELAHIYLHSSNESRVDEQALEWIKARRSSLLKVGAQ
jgi:hypothetical protein